MSSLSFGSERRAEFLAPRQLLSGPGSSESVGSALRGWGVEAGDVLVVADRVVADAGLLEPTLAGLAEAGFSVASFAEIAGEPDDEVVTRAIETARSLAPAAVVGVGGGSAMDTAKLVALLTRNDGRVGDWLGPIVPHRPVAPLALVPTTTGTGAETTRIAMVSVAGSKRIVSCPQFVPLVAALDPELVAGLPGGVVASTALDALAHALESTLSENRTHLTVTLGAEAARIVLADVETAVLDGDRAARGRLLYGAYLAGLALNAGVVLGHSLGYVIARRTHLAHGTSCSLALPYCLAYDRAVDPAVASHVARLVTRGESGELRDAALAVDGLAARVGLPVSLAEVAIGPAELDGMAAETVRDYPRPNNPVPLTEARVRRLLAHMHEGDVAGAWEAMAEQV